MLTASINKCTNDIAQCTQTQVDLSCFFKSITGSACFALLTHTRSHKQHSDASDTCALSQEQGTVKSPAIDNEYKHALQTCKHHTHKSHLLKNSSQEEYLSFGPGKINQVQLAHPDVTPLVIQITALYNNSKDAV
eukprot:20228-Heterococcus_DN1.PRE.4